MNRASGFTQETFNQMTGRTVLSQGAIDALNNIVDQQVASDDGRNTPH